MPRWSAQDQHLVVLAVVETARVGQGVVDFDVAGFGKDEAFSKAASVVAQIKATIDERRWVCFFDYFNPESPDCLSVPDFLAWLRDAKLGRPEQIDYLDKVAGITAAALIFRGPDNQNQQEPWAIYSLRWVVLPSLP